MLILINTLKGFTTTGVWPLNLRAIDSYFYTSTYFKTIEVEVAIDSKFDNKLKTKRAPNSSNEKVNTCLQDIKGEWILDPQTIGEQLFWPSNSDDSNREENEGADEGG